MQLTYLFSICISATLVSCSAKRAQLVGRDVSLLSSYDFLIIGGGTSGLTVADRLTENANTTVLVIETGPLDTQDPSVLVPGLLNLAASPYFFPLRSAPQAGLANRSFSVPAARVVGGGTVVNGLFFDRGSRGDYDAWEALGNGGWGWEGRLGYFRKSEMFEMPEGAFAEEWSVRWEERVHGVDGPVRASFPVFQYPGVKNFFRAWQSLGLSIPEDPAGGNKIGVSWSPSSLDSKNQSRSYARSAHYDRVVDTRSNYHLLTETAVHKVLVSNGRANGVLVQSSGSNQTFEIQATREVILAAGVHSPQILQLSGMGPAQVLLPLGIEQVVDLPGVGANFQDHPTLFYVANYSSPIHPVPGDLTSNATYAAEQLDLYWRARQGAYTGVAQGGNTVSFLSLPQLTPEYLELVSAIDTVNATSIYPSLDSTVLTGYTAQRRLILDQYQSHDTAVHESGFNSDLVIPLTLLKPLSRGSIKVVSKNVHDAPLIDFGTLTATSDLDILVSAVRKNRDFLATPAMQELGASEISPGAHGVSDEDLKAALRQQLSASYSHPCCTCAMMPRELGGVVNDRLEVYGVAGLRVVDASVMPIIPGAHTSATVYAVAEKAADLIKQRYGL